MEIIKTREELNEIENKKTIQKKYNQELVFCKD